MPVNTCQQDSDNSPLAALPHVVDLPRSDQHLNHKHDACRPCQEQQAVPLECTVSRVAKHRDFSNAVLQLSSSCLRNNDLRCAISIPSFVAVHAPTAFASAKATEGFQPCVYPITIYTTLTSCLNSAWSNHHAVTCVRKLHHLVLVMKR